jgi:hypothetical protein
MLLQFLKLGARIKVITSKVEIGDQRIRGSEPHVEFVWLCPCDHVDPS